MKIVQGPIATNMKDVLEEHNCRDDQGSVAHKFKANDLLNVIRFHLESMDLVYLNNWTEERR